MNPLAIALLVLAMAVAGAATPESTPAGFGAAGIIETAYPCPDLIRSGLDCPIVLVLDSEACQSVLCDANVAELQMLATLDGLCAVGLAPATLESFCPAAAAAAAAAAAILADDVPHCNAPRASVEIPVCYIREAPDEGRVGLTPPPPMHERHPGRVTAP